MVKTIVFNGGLGNQMFQYAFYLRMKRKYPLSLFLFDIKLAQGCHNGYELDKIFKINSLSKAKLYRKLKKRFPKTMSTCHTMIQEHSIEYDLRLLKTMPFLTRYNGFWQSEKYFSPVDKLVRKSFTFRDELLSDRTKDEASKLKSINSIAVHVRRGDYVRNADYYGLCSEAYYAKAIDFMRERVSNPMFVFFSDDVEWVKSHIPCDGAKYVTWNKGADSWQDMYLMSCCKHNIIANSSFSWWGAWLNSNADKIVIAPTPWCDYSADYDIVPIQWQKIKR